MSSLFYRNKMIGGYIPQIGDLWKIMKRIRYFSMDVSAPEIAAASTSYVSETPVDDGYTESVIATGLSVATELWTPLGTCTILSADPNPALITCIGHSLDNEDVVGFTTTGALPTGIEELYTYYYVANKDVNTFEIEETIGGGSVVSYDPQSGEHTVYERT